MAGGTRRNVAQNQGAPQNPIQPPQPAIVPPIDAIALLAQVLAGQQQQQNLHHQQQQQQHEAQLEQQAVRDAAAAAAVVAATAAANAQTLALAQAMQQIANNAAQPRSNRKLKEFTGTEREDVDDWIESVDREATAGNWTPETKLNNAKAALRGSASRWQAAPADADDWHMWSISFALAFRKKYTMQQWFELVKARKQKQNEPAAQYALEIQRLQKFCPHPVEESLLVKYAISGIIHTQFSAVLLHYLPETMVDFARIYGSMETNAAFSPLVGSVPNAQLNALESKVEEQAATMQQQGAKLAEFERRDRLKTIERNNSASNSRPAPYPAREARRSFNNPTTVDKCTNCKDSGHLTINCPQPKNCYNCGKPGHLTNSCTQPKNCYNCGEAGHFSRACVAPKPPCFRCHATDHESRYCPRRVDNRPSQSGNASAGPTGASSASKRQ